MTAARLRIIAGHFGGRKIHAAEGSRPTQERVREALFSRWGALLPGCHFVDLFCASGAVGLEALSRGAERALFVDADARRLDVARRNARALGLEDQCSFQRASLPSQWNRLGTLRTAPVLGFADPPYDFEEYEALAACMGELQEVRALAIEHSSRAQWQAPWPDSTVKSYGESALTLCESFDSR